MIKLIAITTMLIDHIGFAFFPEMAILRLIGRIAFPLFALELARGRRRTRSIKKYLTRLLVLAILSQVPYMLFFDTTDLNILFTLFVSLLMLIALDNKIYLAAAGLFALTVMFSFEYGYYGPLTVFLVDKIDLQDIKYTIIYFAVNIFSGFQGFALLAYPLFKIRDKKILPTWLAYGFYPGHLLVLYFLLH
ncbi:MAG TPA: TraX family protein [Oscillospiraceae bacterium]|nr:TraX family protein [Oscillospiraceae bacterium]